MRCRECKNRCAVKTGSCPHCGAALVARRDGASPLATLAGLACVGGLVFKFFFAAPSPAPSPAPRPAEKIASRPPPPFYGAGGRSTGPTINGVSFDRSPYVERVDLNQPAPHPSSR